MTNIEIVSDIFSYLLGFYTALAQWPMVNVTPQGVQETKISPENYYNKHRCYTVIQAM